MSITAATEGYAFIMSAADLVMYPESAARNGAFFGDVERLDLLLDADSMAGDDSANVTCFCAWICRAFIAVFAAASCLDVVSALDAPEDCVCDPASISFGTPGAIGFSSSDLLSESESESLLASGPSWGRFLLFRFPQSPSNSPR
jgi:hypothetical protein